jgi:hypothetical protein
VFLAVGELALHVAYLDGWPARQRIWPWMTALVGLAVSVAGNIGHIEAQPGHPVILADRLTAATSPVAAFAGLAIGLLVLKMIRQRPDARSTAAPSRPALVIAGAPPAADVAHRPAANGAAAGWPAASSLLRERPRNFGARDPILRDARALCHDAAARGERLSQRALARQLRDRGHRFPNQQLAQIAATASLADVAA